MKRVLVLLAAPLLAGGLMLAGASSATAGERHQSGDSHVAGHRHHDTRPAGPGQGHSPAGRGKHLHKVTHQGSHHGGTQVGNHQGGTPCTVAPRCRPEPLPKPPGGWPCAQTHSCASHHHYPICKPPTKPPHHDGPPPAKHVKHLHPAAPIVPIADGLPRTGGLYEAGVVGGMSLIGLGALSLLGLALTKPERRWMRARRLT